MKPTVNISPKEDFINLYLDNLDLITENSSGVLNAVRQPALENLNFWDFPV